MESKLLEYFMKHTTEQFREIKGQLSELQGSMEDLKKFKAEMMVSSRWVSFLISAACGAITLAISTYVALQTGKP